MVSVRALMRSTYGPSFIFLLLSALICLTVHGHLGDNGNRQGKHRLLAKRAAANAALQNATALPEQQQQPSTHQARSMNDPALMDMLESTSLARRQSSSTTSSGGTPNTTKLPTGTCTAKIPCAEDACCNGQICGFGPQFCGSNCTSKCDSKAECGPYAAAGNTNCPLGVCCSKYGFCGTTDEFCLVGCQNGCGEPEPPTACGADAQSATQRRIGYYAGWATDPASRPFNQYPPSMIKANVLTHINYAFALVGSDFKLQAMSANDPKQWSQVIALKSQNPELKVFLSVGGWTFNDPPTSHIFSNLVASAANTNTFINSALTVMQTYGFDGLDIDWEYPGADDRGGVPADRANYVKFMTSLNNAFKSGGRSYGLTWTAPSSYWYLQHFDLQGLTAVTDWINLMTYDLHGVWDGVDPYIGSYVFGHTNLSEIKTSIDLFVRNKIPMSKITLGMAFYARTYTLTLPSCSEPGCEFSGAGRPIGSSVKGGIESYADIQTIISNGADPTFDEKAAIKYLVYEGDQWLSYDDADTWLLKMDYANSICIGGTMIWSVDMDTPQGDALSALYPTIAGIAGSDGDGAQACQVTGCGESCPAGFSSVSKVTVNPSFADSFRACDVKNNPANLCCPTGAAPTQCHWKRGNEVGPCIANSCDVGEVALFQDPSGDGSLPTCLVGYQVLCCKPFQPEPERCVWGGCEAAQGASFGSTCPANFPHVQTKGVQGDPGSQACWDTNENNEKPLCCSSDFTSVYKNCAWYGTVSSCFDNQCPVGQISIATDVAGDAYPGNPSHCTGNIGGQAILRSYCCDPPADTESSIPGSWLFPSGGSGSINETLQIDQDVNTPAASAVEDIHYDDPTDPDHNEFGEVFISSPKAASVSRMDVNSDWVITGCHPASDEPQEVFAYCRKGMNHTHSGCSHVMTGGAQHTIIRLPKTCAKGNWARIDFLDEHHDHTVLPQSHMAKVPAGEKVYRMRFDYNFAAVPASNGPVYMRIDASDIIGYWDEIVDTPMSKRHVVRGTPLSNCTTAQQKRSLHDPELCAPAPKKRWWGAFKDWINRIANTIGAAGLQNAKHYSFAQVFTIFHQEEKCTINGVDYASSMDISATLNANADLQYGLYVQGTVVPPAITSAYLDFNIAASGSATLKLEALAAAHYSSGNLELLRVGFPGLSYPGLVTVGPSLAVYGELEGDISLQGTLSVTQGVEFPATGIKLGWSGSDDSSNGALPSVTPHREPASLQATVVKGNINFSGSLTAHVQPSVELGIRILGGSLMDAQVFGRVDLSANAALGFSTRQLCITPSFNAALQLGYTGSALIWSSGPVVYPLGSYTVPFDAVCGPQLSRRDFEEGETVHHLYASTEDPGFKPRSVESYNVTKKRTLPSDFGRQAAEYGAVQTNILRDEHGTQYVGKLQYPIEQTSILSGSVADSAPTSLQKRAGVPYLPGNLFCPESGDGPSCTPIEFGGFDDPEDGGYYYRRRSFINDTLQPLPPTPRMDVEHDESGQLISSQDAETSLSIRDESEENLVILQKRVKLGSCPYTLRPAAYGNAPDLGTWDFSTDGATTISPTVARNFPSLLTVLSTGSRQNQVTFYAREHVYEMNMLTRFIDEQLRTNLQGVWQVNGANTDFCTGFFNPYLRNAFGGRPEAMMTTLRNCQPRNNGRGMPRLQQEVNKAKTFRGKSCPDIKVLALRQAAGALSYMNDGVTRTEFLAIHQCVSAAWDSWHADYVRQPGVPAAANNVIMSDEVRSWVTGVLSTFNTQIRSNINALINDWSNTYGNALQSVDLSYGAYFEPRAKPFTTSGGPIPHSNLQVKTDDLNTFIAGRVAGGITWINQL
ncbi:hypothetical protein OC861_006279 [Tilletia horrida]|nr:hypothetical protein OC861_006279 [Tilletia horrida]